VGTVIFGLAVNPGNDDVWATNTEARNIVSLEPRLRGRFATNRVTRLTRAGDAGRRVRPVDINSRVRGFGNATLQSAKEHQAIAQPLGVAFDMPGERAFVTGLGSANVSILSTNAIVTAQIDVGFGPTGVIYNTKRNRLYVQNSLDATLSVIDLDSKSVVQTVGLRHAPTPVVVWSGRSFLYDAG
jgi:YVTN family beta-propeller protein